MRFTTIPAPLFCVALLAACADGSPTSLVSAPAPAVVPAEANPVPLKFHGDCGPFTITVSDGLLHVSFYCAANITHLGNSLIWVEQVAALVPGQGPIQDGWETITAANGDQLYIHHVADQGGADETGHVWYSGNVEIVGGTGRFAEATGTGTYGGAADTAENKGYFDLSAMMRYAAGQRAQR